MRGLLMRGFEGGWGYIHEERDGKVMPIDWISYRFNDGMT